MTTIIKYMQQTQLLNNVKMKNNEMIGFTHSENDEPIKTEVININIIKPLTTEIENNIHTGEQSIPILDFIKVDGEKHILGDVQSFENINKDLNINKTEFMKNCISHENAIDNTSIIFNNSNENYHLFIRSILKKFHTNECIQENDLYINIGNTIIYSLLNLNSECVKDAIHLFSDTYSFTINNLNISESNLLDTNSLENAETTLENSSNNKNEIAKIKINEEKSILSAYRNRILISTATIVGGAIAVKCGVPAMIYAGGMKLISKDVISKGVSSISQIGVPPTESSTSIDKEDAHHFFKVVMSWFH